MAGTFTFIFRCEKSVFIRETYATSMLALLPLSVERAAEVLPTLQNLFIEGFQPSRYVLGAIRQFVAARQLSDHPVNINPWIRNVPQISD
ncbi:hypothetical protein BJV74DRAFT_367595 [Russula compacta]|nr:hypothetical protein BJV74DRAFT_367595 [Russula compacta]